MVLLILKNTADFLALSVNFIVLLNDTPMLSKFAAISAALSTPKPVAKPNSINCPISFLSNILFLLVISLNLAIIVLISSSAPPYFNASIPNALKLFINPFACSADKPKSALILPLILCTCKKVLKIFFNGFKPNLTNPVPILNIPLNKPFTTILSILKRLRIVPYAFTIGGKASFAILDFCLLISNESLSFLISFSNIAASF